MHGRRLMFPLLECDRIENYAGSEHDDAARPPEPGRAAVRRAEAEVS
jgi:hypothetical protein